MTDELRELLQAGVPLSQAAHQLQLPFTELALGAGDLGLGVLPREVKLPRGMGYDKASTLRHIWALARYDGTARQYARAQGLQLEHLCTAFERYCPTEWADYLAFHPAPERRQCEYCRRDFIPNAGKQRYCDPKCAGDARADRTYFNGQRRAALGMRQGVCQVCGRHGTRKLAAHHMLGKDQDPDGKWLIALCAGCHRLVTELARNALTDDPAKLEALLSLTRLRRHGTPPPPR